MNEDFLPLAYLNAWEYCHRRFYLEYELGEMEDNEHILMGRHLHRNINEEGVSEEEGVTIHRQQWVWSDRLLVSGIIDAVEERDGLLIPLEYKKGKMGNHLNDRFQLCAAALCLEERLGREIAWGEIFYAANKRRQKIIFSPQLRQMTETAIWAAKKAVTGAIPPPIDNAKKCQDCSLQGICLPFEVKQLRQEMI
ncbi:MAG: CRISPR-associated protein Cas4 [Richelia sp. CSU_2_1]|nr:CRISPR-associated protein Cas4 [Microcoleus sp. SU_5_6]NJL68334.1 CRISPR-associated protein Cas4 [Microcoleus sp. SM1_3_4]NJR25467.1 CRISPR-associated protein Cas4 [Richelia sp. CSU_2_1]